MNKEELKELLNKKLAEKLKSLSKKSTCLNEANSDKFTWHDINQAMLNIGFGPRVIVKLAAALAGKKINEEEIEESEQKLKSLGQQFPEVADAAAKVIRSYITNPKKPIKQTINSVVEETGVNRGNLLKILNELGLGLTDE